MGKNRGVKNSKVGNGGFLIEEKFVRCFVRVTFG